MICGGIDAGSRAIKVVLVDEDSSRVLATGVTDQGVDQPTLASALLDDVARRAGVSRSDVGRVVATGYGRDALEFADITITEITCHARGVHHVMPEARTVVDIGGQDSKLLRLEANGRVRDFNVNDRCAAGTGRFLEIVAARVDTGLSELGEIAARSENPSRISSMCVVFAETEIVGLLASGEPPENIVAGVQSSIASRIATLAGRNVVEPVAFTGGVAMISGMRDALEAALQRTVTVCPTPQMTGALGAALLAGHGAGGR